LTFHNTHTELASHFAVVLHTFVCRVNDIDLVDDKSLLCASDKLS